MNAWRGNLLRDGARTAMAGLVLALVLLGAAGCGAEQASAENADIDKTVAVDGWEVTLTAAPEKHNVVGEGGFTSQAQGTYVIIPLRVTNKNADITLFPPKLATMTDGQGNSFTPTGSTPQFNYVQSNKGLKMLLDAPMQPGETRATVLLFDIPADAAELTLKLEGSDDTLRLGF